jgi:hypothetical protein
VERKRSILIVTDGAKATQALAEQFAAALDSFTVKIAGASGFEGTDLLPADVFFLGCESVRPSSFKYLETLLRHINLADRSCGLFSPSSQEALDYLSGLVQASEARVGKPFLGSKITDPEESRNWAKSILKVGKL